jgi:antitoxin ParD1/3/4
MSTMNISLPEPLKQFVDERVSKAGYGTSSEYVRELMHLRSLLLEGAASPVTGKADEKYFASLRLTANQKLSSKFV